ncbi:hypothetical protein RB653_006260 [Dictyostelium firmibasis]|uniref:Cytochrome P450 n=1 Tax=Dictyostelium firmibasis TaxID=79012 RepID=A0AAN7Z554_9MYCE
MATLLLIIIFMITFIFYKNFDKKRKNNYPPGPINLPFIGGLYKLKLGKQHLSLDELYQKYGKVFSIKFGSYDTVILNEPDVIIEAFHLNSTSFMDRMILPSFKIVGKNQNIGFTQTEYWKKIRGILNVSLTKSKTRLLENLFNQEYLRFDQFIKKQLKSKNDSMFIRPYLKRLSFNIIFSYLFNETIPYEDELIPKDILDFIHASEELLVVLSQMPSDYIKVLRPFESHKKLNEICDRMSKFIKPKVDKRVENLDEETPKCFIDYLILQIRSEPSQVIKIEAIQYICIDLLVGGTDSTSSALEWMILFLSNHDSLQEKLYSEICKNTIGADDIFPKLIEKNNYPFFNACVKETLRKSPPVPLGLPHKCSEDAEIGGYIIPKGTQIISNLYSASNCEKVFTDPHEFNPLRFIDISNINNNNILSFSIGPRICPGKNLSEDELFSFGTKLFKTFKFSRPNKNQLYDEVAVLGITLEPKPFITKVSLR